MDIKFYYTTIEPFQNQNNILQSIGGFKSNNEVYKKTLLSEDCNIFDSEIFVDDLSIFDIDSTCFVNGEILKVVSKDSNLGSIKVERSKKYFHSIGDYIFVLSKINNTYFDESGKQYRCFAVQNNEGSLSDLTVRILDNPVNFGVEFPKNDYLASSTSDPSSNVTIIDSSLNSLFEDGHFVNSYLEIDGYNRKITDYSSSGVFTLESSLPNNINSGMAYDVLSGISTKIKNERIKPKNIEFNTLKKKISLNDHGSIFKFNDVFYIWLEVNNNFDFNNILINIEK